MEIRRLLWDDVNDPHLLQHGITADKADELVKLDVWVVSRHPSYPDQVRIVGHTRSGRWLTIVLEPTHLRDVWRPVTGWDATHEEVAYWREQNP